jgi:hypothetical protein
MYLTPLLIIQIFEVATREASGSSYPTLYASIPIYNYILDELEDEISPPKIVTQKQKIAVEVAYEKMKKYYAWSGADCYNVAMSKFL